MFTAIVLFFFVLPVVAGAMKFALRLVGWTLSVVLGVVLLPVWIMVAVVCGLAFAMRWLLPIMLVIFVASLFSPEV